MYRFGMILSSFAYNPVRWQYITRSLTSLSKTDTEFVFRPHLLLTFRPAGYDYGQLITELARKFEVSAISEESFTGHPVGLDPSFIYSANYMVSSYLSFTHLIFMQDDFLYNPDWLKQLQCLVSRHPDAKAWTVYRSSHTRHHRILRTDEHGDCLVTSIAGIGTMSVKEWMEYNPDPTHGHGWFSVPPQAGGGNTLDLHHPWSRPGERWATGRDYWESIGAMGTHSQQAVSIDRAVDFVGE